MIKDTKSKSENKKKKLTKDTAGTLLYRLHKARLEVLLVHPSGNYNRKAAWSIPKGQPEKLESYEEAARRETFEETGIIACALKPLGYIDYASRRKRVHCFYGAAPVSASPQCASWEVDRAEFIPIEKAKKMIHQDQAELLERLQFILNSHYDYRQ